MTFEQLEREEVLSIIESAHSHLEQAFAELAKIRGRAGNMTDIAAFKCGEALGSIHQAKALVQQDITERRRAH